MLIPSRHFDLGLVTHFEDEWIIAVRNWIQSSSRSRTDINSHFHLRVKESMGRGTIVLPVREKEKVLLCVCPSSAKIISRTKPPIEWISTPSFS